MKAFSKRLFWLLLVGVVCLSSWLRPAIASGPDPRLIQLEFEVSALQNQLRQIQNQLSRQPGTVIDPRPAQPIERPAGLPDDLPFDMQFDNLATLVIEINQRVIAIENQLSDSFQ